MIVKTDVETKFLKDLKEVENTASNLEFGVLLQKFLSLVGLLSDPKNGDVLTILDKVLDVKTKAFLDLCVIAFDPDPFTTIPLFGGNEIMGKSYNLNNSLNNVSKGGGKKKGKKRTDRAAAAATRSDIVPYSPRRLSRSRTPEEHHDLMMSLGASAGDGDVVGAEHTFMTVTANLRALTPEQLREFKEIYEVRQQGIIIRQHMEMKQDKERYNRRSAITYALFAMSVGGAGGHTWWYNTAALGIAAVGTGAKLQQAGEMAVASGSSFLGYVSSLIYTTNSTELNAAYEAARQGAAATAAATIEMGHAFYNDQYVQYVMMGCAAGLGVFLLLKCMIDLAGKNFGLNISTPLFQVSMHSNRAPTNMPIGYNPYMRPVGNRTDASSRTNPLQINGDSSRRNPLQIKGGGTNKIRNNSSSKNNNNNRNNKSNKKKNKKYRKNNSNKKKKKNTKNKTKK